MVETDFSLSSLYERSHYERSNYYAKQKVFMRKNEALIKLSGGDTITDLVVAADGKRSEIAKKAAFLDFHGITGKSFSKFSKS